MKKHLFGVAILACLLVAGFASAQTIDLIQEYTVAGVPASPYAGQTVTVSGIVIERQQYSGGSGYIWAAGDGGIAFYSTTGTAALGDLIEITGTVAVFSGEVQFSNPTWAVTSAGNTAVPVDMTITQALSTYENVGNYTRCIGTVTSKPNTSNFYMTDGTDTIQVYIDSTTGISLGAVAVGDVYQVTAPLVNFNTTMELKPILQAHLVENPLGDTVPVIASVNCANWAPTASTPIVVSAVITDNIGVSTATLWYRNSNGVTPGSWASVPMSNTGGDNYSGTIPASHPQSQVDFYLQATDTAAQVASMPGDAPTGFYSVAIGFTSIYAMQTVHPDSVSQANKFVGKFLNVTGVVTAAGPAQLGAGSKLIVQELAKNPATDSYAFGGVLVYESSAKYPYYQGDVVEVGGHGDEYFGLTEMIPHNGDAINLVSFGHALPQPAVVRTRALADDMPVSDGNGAFGEAWESVWVRAFNGTVMDTVGLAQYNEFIISDTGARADSLVVDTYADLAYVPTIGDVITINSFMDYEFGTFKIRPIDDSFITIGNLSAVDNNLPTIEKAGGFRSVAPNPFNPLTTIKFVVNRSDLVQLNVYNIRGEKVRTLVQDALPATEYSLTWDGTDDSGRSVASGSYFARLRIGKEVMQVRQMQLVK
jgi:hypothetical protein